MPSPLRGARRPGIVVTTALLAAVCPLPGPTATAASCPEVVAHRGNVDAPENSTAAFRNAVLAGARVVEMDLRFTRTHRVVVMHDSTVDRTTNGTGRVADLSLTAIQSLTLDTGPNAAALALAPPTVYAAARAARDAGATAYRMQLKVTPTREELDLLVTRLGQLGITDETTLTSTSAERLRQVRAAYPGLRTALVGGSGSRPDPALVRSAGTSYHGSWPTLTPTYVAALHAAGVRVYGYTANTSDAWESLRRAGADGLLTDRTREYLRWAAAHC